MDSVLLFPVAGLTSFNIAQRRRELGSLASLECLGRRDWLRPTAAILLVARVMALVASVEARGPARRSLRLPAVDAWRVEPKTDRPRLGVSAPESGAVFARSETQFAGTLKQSRARQPLLKPATSDAEINCLSRRKVGVTLQQDRHRKSAEYR